MVVVCVGELADRRCVAADAGMAMGRTDDEQAPPQGARNAAELIAQDNAAPVPSTARANLSSIMPGWFSEISPMWPGTCTAAACLSSFVCNSRGRSRRICFLAFVTRSFMEFC